MAYTSTSAQYPVRKGIFARIGAAIMRLAEARLAERTRQIDALEALSDEELARRGISRDMIVMRVFSDKRYI